jgi:PKD repeat protein
MTIPKASLFPTSFDTDKELLLVHDSLRVRLLEDYKPGDKIIYIEGDNSFFPATGYITLTEQCNEASLRALTFYYSTKTDTTFEGLELLPEFTDVAKPKRQTNVTMNVTAAHHNAIKDALIAIQTFVGIKGTDDTRPLGATMEGRLNFLRKLVLRPRAWFSADRRVGIIPLKVKFSDLSFRDPTSRVWDFGDGTISGISSTVSNISTVSTTIEHVYYTPGVYDVTLTAINAFGEDKITLPSLINARTKAPDDAVISVTPGAFQIVEDIDSSDTYLLTHLLPGIIKTRVNTYVDLAIVDTGDQVGDPILKYTWKLGDDVNHADSAQTKASYSVGGIYDIKVRIDTKYGAYRTTVLRNAIEVVEKKNLFLLNFDPDATGVTQNVTPYEFGLVSETFKTKNRSTNPITRDHRFLDSSITNYSQQKREFLRNNGFANRTNILSGDNGTAMMYWAEGGVAGSSVASQNIRLTEYEGFTDIWRTPTSFTIDRPWNWIGINAPNAIYFMFGNSASGGTDSPTNPTRTMIEFVGLTRTDTTLTTSNFKNGADELLKNVGTGGGGNFSVYRSTWLNSNGYILRNDGVNAFFRLKSFYKTEGILSDPLLYTRKLPDMPGSPKIEGQMVGLTQGVYFFNNSGEIAVYSPTTNTWAVGGPGVNSPTFRSLQDSTVSGFDEASNTLIATSDADRRAYLSYDYSTNVFLKFNEADLTFVSLIPRPKGEQFVCGVF